MSTLEISAASMAPAAKNWLVNTYEAQVLHIFDIACNLINERREVLSIVTPQIGNGPLNLVVDDMVCFSEHLDLHSSVVISNRKLILGGLTIQIENANLWNPRPDWERLHEKLNHIRNQLAQLRIINHQFSNSLSSSLAVADLPASLTAAKQLAGLGAGLTPSGDDFIMGAIHAAWIIHPPAVTGTLAREIADTAAPRTTSLSAAWLRSAGKGEAGILWHEFFGALLSTEGERIQQAVDKILTIGETSGADALAGFCSTLRSVSPQSNL